MLNGAAPAAGFPVLLASDDAAATVPLLITIPAGNDRANFNVTTRAVTTTRSATIAANLSPPINPANPTQILEGATTARLAIFGAPRTASVSAVPTQVTAGSPFALTLTHGIEHAEPGGGLINRGGSRSRAPARW